MVYYLTDTHSDRVLDRVGVLSMKLYALYVAGLLKSLNEANLDCVIYVKFVGTPSYADDIALAAVFPRSLQKMIHIGDQYACQWRLLLTQESQK